MESAKEVIIRELKESANVKRMIGQGLSEEIASAAQMIADVLMTGGKILLMGNGGSAADAQHIASEFVGHFQSERKGLRAIALTTDTSILTSIANDYGYESVFSRQVETLADSNDVLIAISTSGMSANILKAVEYSQIYILLQQLWPTNNNLG